MLPSSLNGGLWQLARRLHLSLKGRGIAYDSPLAPPLPERGRSARSCAPGGGPFFYSAVIMTSSKSAAVRTKRLPPGRQPSATATDLPFQGEVEQAARELP